MLSLNAGLRSSALVAGNLADSSVRFDASITRLATGQRTAQSGESSSTLALASRFSALVSEQRQVAYNISQASSIMQTASGALSLMHEMLERLKALTTQASNDAIGADARVGMASEILALVDQLNQTALGTHFGSLSLLNGQTVFEDGIKRSAYSMLLGNGGSGEDASIILTIPNVEPMELFFGAVMDVGTTASAKEAQGVVEGALDRITAAEAEVGAQQSVLDMQLERARSLMLFGTESRSELADTDIPAESITLSITRVLQGMSISVLAQLHAMQDDSLRLVDQET